MFQVVLKPSPRLVVDEIFQKVQNKVVRASGMFRFLILKANNNPQPFASNCHPKFKALEVIQTRHQFVGNPVKSRSLLFTVWGFVGFTFYTYCHNPVKNHTKLAFKNASSLNFAIIPSFRALATPWECPKTLGSLSAAVPCFCLVFPTLLIYTSHTRCPASSQKRIRNLV